MNANIKGCLRNLRKCWKDLEHNDKPLTYQECKKILLWADNKGYQTTEEIKDCEIDVLLIDFIKPVKTLLYYDIPQIVLCNDLKGNGFVIVAQEDDDYVGKQIPPHILERFMKGETCLLTAFKQSEHGYFKTSYHKKKDVFHLEPFEPKNEHLPNEGHFHKSI